MADPLADLDLNLLRTLDVLLAHRSVTAAAEVLGRSQPAVSHALARLRTTLDDPLLVRQGRSMVLTPRAEALEAPVRRVLGDLRTALTEGAAFDPATATRTFRLASPDVLAPAVPQVLRACAEAPGVHVEIVADRGARSVDAADVVLDVLPDAAPGVVARPLGRLTQVVAGRRGHPAFDDWGLDAYCRWPHVLVRTSDAAPSLVEQALAAVGRQRTVGLTVPAILLATHVVADSDLLFTGPRELLGLLAPRLALVLRTPPCAMPRVKVAAMWSARFAADPGHRWFRRTTVAVLERLLQADP